MYTGSNPSALRSQRLIADALISLLEEGRPFVEISATELCRRAGVSRQTFYKMFGTLENVVRYVMRTRCEWFEALVMKRAQFTYEELVEAAILFFDSQRSLAEALVSNNLQALVQEQMQLSLDVMLLHYRREAPLVMDDLNRSFLAGGLCSMLLTRMRDGDELSVKDRARRFSDLVTISSFACIA